MKKILLLSDFSRDPDRQTIRGITRFRKNGECWIPYHVAPFMRYDSSRIEDIVIRAKSQNADAVFGAWPVVEDGKQIDLDIPIVLKPSRQRVRGFSEFRSDSDAVGKMAAEFFASLGLTNLSFSGMSGAVWSAERCECFKKYSKCSVLDGIRFSDAQVDYDKISAWLKKLPKPIGIFCCNDLNASMLIEICIGNGIRIPEEVAVLGVDDDEFLCNITSPSISSIRLDYEMAGYELASKLTEQIESGAKGVFVFTHNPVCIVERNSTPKRKVVDRYVKEVVDFMGEHFREGIDLKDALESIPLSRRSIEIRFKKEFGSMTMAGYLTKLKLDCLKHLLSTSSLSLLDAMAQSGFSEGENVYRLFRNKVGCTPAEYRASHNKDLDG